MGLFGGMFDLNGDGKVGPIEQTLEFMFINELLREEKEAAYDDLLLDEVEQRIYDALLKEAEMELYEDDDEESFEHDDLFDDDDDDLLW